MHLGAPIDLNARVISMKRGNVQNLKPESTDLRASEKSKVTPGIPLYQVRALLLPCPQSSCPLERAARFSTVSRSFELLVTASPRRAESEEGRAIAEGRQRWSQKHTGSGNLQQVHPAALAI
jgi:hypothetical protein